MKNYIKILDCTLRDGGFVNDWKFGDKASLEIFDAVSKAGVAYSEVGFLRNEPYQKGRMVFNDIKQVESIFPEGRIKRALLVEQGYDFPIESLPYRDETSIEMIRVMIWKRNIIGAVDYCKYLMDKGYEVAVQATRSDEYTEDEFRNFIEAYNAIVPKAIYIVDSFGLFTREHTLRYTSIADKYMNPDIILGLHLHNNQQQALANVLAFLSNSWNHRIMLDATIMGMGRGAGNLPLEVICNVLNKEYEGEYDVISLLEVMDKYVDGFTTQSAWGYQIPYFLSSYYGRNPSYATLMVEKRVPYVIQNRVFAAMKSEGKGIKLIPAELEDYLKKLS